ncbi:MAG: hypothetical protein SFZ24_09240 [Planctomycetota bacterium]|nr:hypothetical protein [Planctomycetota bacterium]
MTQVGSRVGPGLAVLVAAAVVACGSIAHAQSGKSDADVKNPGPSRPTISSLLTLDAAARRLSTVEPPAPASAPPASALLVPADETSEGGGAMPANDACASATQISGIGTFNFSTVGATTDGLSHFACNFFGQSQISSDVWYRWTAPASATFVIETCSQTALDTKMAVYSPGSCTPGDGRVLDCDDDTCSRQSRLTFNATANLQYLIRIGHFPGGTTGSGQFKVRYQTGQNICPFPAANCQTADLTDAYEATSRLIRDDFNVTAGGSINGICVRGAYFDGLADCAGSELDDFIIRYRADAGGEPAEILAEYTRGEYTQTGPVATGNLIAGGFNEYVHSFAHPPLSVFAGECIWVEIVNDLTPPPNGACSWYWATSETGNGIGFQDSTRIDTDFAFCLSRALGDPELCGSSAPPANDQCATAQPIGSNTTFFGADNLFATTSSSDPLYSCRAGGPGRGVGTLWFRFTASATSARVNLCNNFSGDTLLAVYRGTCGSLVEIACSDDFCSFRSQVCVTGLTVGQTYFIQLSTYDADSQGPYDLQVTSPCPATPVNDVCSGAANLAVPGSVSSSTVNATTDTTVPTCNFSLAAAPGVWYRVTGNGRRYTASLCVGTSFDTKLSVFCGSCDRLFCVAQNDDDCGPQSRVSWCTANGQVYYILVSGFSGQSGPFFLTTATESTPCTGAVSCAPCDYACPPGAIAETEACGGDTNGGCNDFGNATQPISCGQTVCGTVSTFGNVRDTDWYQFTLTVPSIVTWTVQSESSIEASLLSGSCPATVLYTATSPRCGTTVASGLLNAGTYRAFVAPTIDGYQCGPSNNYIASLTCAPVGACCIGAECRRIPQSDCTQLGGVYGGDSTACPITYNAQTCGSAFENITAAGSRVLLDGDGSAAVPLGFPFRFYGVEYASVNVSANGYLTFDAPTTNPTNVPIPNQAAPNAYIAPLWDDLALDAGGTLHVQTLGTAPNRRFVAQWTGVPQFLQSDANTFQAVLFESGGCIEFRYGAFTPESPAGDYTIGVENQAGSSGTSISAGSLTAGACRRLCPALTSGCDSLAVCPGDANGDRTVNFEDIVAVLANWGSAGPLADVDRNGVVEFADIVEVFRFWGSSCALVRPCSGDANGDRTVDFEDVVSVLANWGSGGPVADVDRNGLVEFADVVEVFRFWEVSCPAAASSQ